MNRRLGHGDLRCAAQIRPRFSLRWSFALPGLTRCRPGGQVIGNPGHLERSFDHRGPAMTPNTTSSAALFAR
jgi:hypothetical protein